MEDPYLSTFLADIQKVSNGLCTLVEFLIGLSYFCGKQLAGAIIAAAHFLWMALSEGSLWARYIIEQIIELEKYIISCIFLIYFGICQIFEAFYITFQDLKSFIQHFAESLTNLSHNSFTAVITSVQALTIIPEQLWAALSIVGDFTFSTLYSIYLLVLDFSMQLVLAPLNVMIFAGKVILSIFTLPALLFKDITMSAVIGICVLAALYYFFHRRLVIKVFQNVWLLLKWIWNAFGNMSSQLYCLVFRQKSRCDGDKVSPSSGKAIKGICVVCQENPVVFIAQPCRHVCLCRDCVRTLIDFDRRCPMCRRPVDQYEQVYIS